MISILLWKIQQLIEQKNKTYWNFNNYKSAVLEISKVFVVNENITTIRTEGIWNFKDLTDWLNGIKISITIIQLEISKTFGVTGPMVLEISKTFGVTGPMIQKFHDLCYVWPNSIGNFKDFQCNCPNDIGNFKDFWNSQTNIWWYLVSFS